MGSGDVNFYERGGFQSYGTGRGRFLRPPRTGPRGETGVESCADPEDPHAHAHVESAARPLRRILRAGHPPKLYA
jgi:hypothetical protein